MKWKKKRLKVLLTSTQPNSKSKYSIIDLKQPPIQTTKKQFVPLPGYQINPHQLVPTINQGNTCLDVVMISTTPQISW